LSESRKKVILSGLKTHKRDTLKKLFQLLNTNEAEEPAAAEVYKKLFKQAYSKQKDYLLRNEYRLLYDYCTQRASTRVCSRLEPEALGTLRTSLQLKAYELFEQEYKTCWIAATTDDNLSLQIAYLDLYNAFLLEGKDAKPSSGKGIRSL
jgi:hypothetical protein